MSAAAQTKISGTAKCGKPEYQLAVEAGDRKGHMLVVFKPSCTWTMPIEMAGVKAKSYTAAISSDAGGERAQDRGYVVVTMENGDQAFAKFQGTGLNKQSGAHSDEGTWTFTGGTGVLKGITGKGTYKRERRRMRRMTRSRASTRLVGR
ncbi:MAG: hypothetical protein JWP63_1889 [Candidatus Solibacter sp.]|nr:hypothetical protein [Candidatus Solibacter sp.]